MSVSETNWGVQGSKPHTPAEVDEHAIISSVHGKKVFPVGSDGSLMNKFLPEKYDYVAVTYPDTTSEVYTFKTGGVSGTTVATVTLVYTDTTRSDLTSVAKT